MSHGAQLGWQATKVPWEICRATMRHTRGCGMPKRRKKTQSLLVMWPCQCTSVCLIHLDSIEMPLDQLLNLLSGNATKQKWIPSISSLNLTIKRSAERTEDQRNQRLHRPPSSKCCIQMLGAYAGDKMFRTANQPTPLNMEHDWNKGACVMPLSDCEYTYNIIKSVSEITLLWVIPNMALTANACTPTYVVKHVWRLDSKTQTITNGTNVAFS